MIIQKRRIRSLKNYLPDSALGSEVVIAIRGLHRFRQKLNQVGLTSLEVGASVLPSTSFGARSRFNANGKDEPQRHLPKEEVCCMRFWCRQEWRGRDQSQEVCDLRDRCYKRFPRKHIPAPSIELTVTTNPQGKKLVVAPALVYAPENQEHLLHIINLFLEIFGECEILQPNFAALVKVPIKRANWRILPPGRYPWSRIHQEAHSVVQRAPRGNQKLIWSRMETIGKHNPAFMAIGQAGFSGYFVLGFPEKDLYVLESIACNNATYVLGEDWEHLSQLTKAELLNSNLHKERFVHRLGWHKQVYSLLG